MYICVLVKEQSGAYILLLLRADCTRVMWHPIWNKRQSFCLSFCQISLLKPHVVTIFDITSSRQLRTTHATETTHAMHTTEAVCTKSVFFKINKGIHACWHYVNPIIERKKANRNATHMTESTHVLICHFMRCLLSLLALHFGFI